MKNKNYLIYKKTKILLMFLKFFKYKNILYRAESNYYIFSLLKSYFSFNLFLSCF